MKAYINTDNVVLAIGENDNLFVGCTSIEVNQEEIDFINSCKLPKWIDGVFIEGISSEDILNNNLEKETQKYIQRSNDGLNAYARLSAEFRIAKQLGQISEESHAAIEKLLIPVRNEILAGQWISGLNELVSIGSEIIGQDLYDRLFNQISAYIEVNYSLIEQQVSKIQTSKSK